MEGGGEGLEVMVGRGYEWRERGWKEGELEGRERGWREEGLEGRERERGWSCGWSCRRAVTGASLLLTV